MGTTQVLELHEITIIVLTATLAFLNVSKNVKNVKKIQYQSTSPLYFLFYTFTLTYDVLVRQTCTIDRIMSSGNNDAPFRYEVLADRLVRPNTKSQNKYRAFLDAKKNMAMNYRGQFEQLWCLDYGANADINTVCFMNEYIWGNKVYRTDQDHCCPYSVAVT